MVLGVVLLFGTRDVKISHDKMIIADGAGYYVYLPAIFIYHDLTFDFFNSVYPKYYPSGYNPPTKNFINEFDSVKVDKYFPGVAVLCLPFFLLAHVLALLFGLEPDGYSAIYQYTVGLAAIIYCWIGLIYIKKILNHLKFSAATITWTIVSIFIGTNLLYQTIYYPSASHVFLFFLISILAYHLLKLMDDDTHNKTEMLCKSMFFLALIAITRPQDIIVLLLLPFLGSSIPKIYSILKSAYQTKMVLAILFLCILIVLIVPTLWYLQTGKFYLNPYHGEHYYFNNPHFFSALFSFRKGWLLYTPMVAISLLGLLKMDNKMKSIHVFIFLCLIVFINSCWWSWTYGPTSYSQRAMVDFYFLQAILLAFFIESVQKNFFFYFKRVLLVLLFLLSILQTYQFKHGIIPSDNSSAELYFHNFFKVHTMAIYPIPKDIITNYSEVKNDFENQKNKTPNQLIDTESFSGKYATFTNENNPYSAGGQISIPRFMKHDGLSKIRASAMVKSNPEKGSCSLVFDFNRSGKSVFWFAYQLKNFVIKNEWTKVEFGMVLPDSVLPATDSLRYYFWDDKGGKAFIDDLKVEFITIDPTYELRP